MQWMAIWMHPYFIKAMEVGPWRGGLIKSLGCNRILIGNTVLTETNSYYTFVENMDY
jgi:hypothetical protein